MVDGSLTGAADTIVAIATGSPDGGVAIVRLSGSDVRTIITPLLSGAWPSARKLVRRRLQLVADGCSAVTGADQEDALMVWMPGPASFTGEDVVELHVHGGELNVRAIVSRIIDLGARPAEAGEFSRRAFTNGRLSLDEAEGLAAVIGARTELELRRGRRLLSGELGREVRSVAAKLGELRMQAEALVDFPEDVDADLVAGWLVKLSKICVDLDTWLANMRTSGTDRGDFRVVIAGPANAGKSSLFNRLLGRSRAIVADAPGTTRDFVESAYWLDGRRASLIDTAGVRTSNDDVEQLGIGLSREQWRGADAVVWVESQGGAVDDEVARARDELQGCSEAGELPVLWVESKCDLGRAQPEWLGVSVRTDDPGQRQLVDWLRARHVEHVERFDAAWVGMARHGQSVAQALEFAREALELGKARGSDLEFEVFAFLVEAGRARLMEILGERQMGAVGDDVLREIFSNFCIGK